jgi:hypothetical protein
MTTRFQQISQITQTVEVRVRLRGFKGYQTEASQESLQRLCNLRNLQRNSLQENL